FRPSAVRHPVRLGNRRGRVRVSPARPPPRVGGCHLADRARARSPLSRAAGAIIWLTVILHKYRKNYDGHALVPWLAAFSALSLVGAIFDPDDPAGRIPYGL